MVKVLVCFRMGQFTKGNGKKGSRTGSGCYLVFLMRSLSADSMAGKSLMDKRRFCLQMVSTSKVKSNLTCATTPARITTQTKMFMRDPGIMIAVGARTVGASGSRMEAQSMLNSSLTWRMVMWSLMTRRATSSCLRLRTPKTLRQTNNTT